MKQNKNKIPMWVKASICPMSIPASTGGLRCHFARMLLFSLFMLCSTIASAQQVEVTLTEAGTLSQKIPSGQKYEITSLKVSGPINGTDVRYLREMAGRNHYGKNTDGKLVDLDLTDVNVVKGGFYYYYNSSSGYDDYYTENDTIGIQMFRDCNLRKIKLPKSVTSIGFYAFYGCSSLISVTIPNSVTSIGFYAFYGCSSLISVTIPNSVTSIESSAFYGCSSLISVTIPNSVTSIERSAFYGCSSLISVTIPNSVTSIERSAFYGCSNLKKLIMLPNTAPSGISSAFDKDKTRMVYVANNNYDNFSELGTIKVYPHLSSLFEVDGVIYVPINPSQRTCDVIDCNYSDTISKIVVPETVSYKGVAMYSQVVNDYSFYKCPKSGEAILANNGYIGNSAFYDCDSLKSVSLANNEYVGDSAFYSCDNLKYVNVIGNVTSIGNSVFEECTGLSDLTIQGKVTSLGYKCFSGCTSLSEITLTDSLTTIGNYAFHSTGLKQFSFPTELTQLGAFAFSDCKKLESVNINGKVTYLGYALFFGCSSLSRISIPANIKSIGNSAFRRCTSLATLIIENDTDTLSLECNYNLPLFTDCPLDSVYVGTHISYNTSSDYGYSPFYRNTTLRAVCLGDNVSKVYDNEFYGCTGLKTAIVGENVTEIGNYAFSGCSSMESFIFGKNVQTIGNEAFSDCTALTKLESHSATPPTCGTEALDDINKWNCTLYVPQTSLAAYQIADQWKEFFFIEGKDPTGISQIRDNNGNNKVIKRYDSNGHPMVKPFKGLNILKMSDGTTRKVIVK